VGREENAILVPEVALGFDQLGRYVLVVNDKNVVERRQVITGPEENGFIVIDSGLKPEERVIVNGLQRAIPGREVSPEVQEAASPAQARQATAGG
jgi:multidrug efflux pump subunit AcrA (membrane-fusion protein)